MGLRQEVNTYLSMVFVGVLALGAAYVIISFANKEDFVMASSVYLEESR